MSESQNKPMTSSDKLGTMPMGKLLANMSIPAITSMFVQALYNIVDSLYVARLGEEALTAISLVFPMQMLQTAFCVGLGIGVNSLVARRLGEGNREGANRGASCGLFLAMVHCVLFILLGLTCVRPFMSAFTQNANIIEMGTVYLTIVMVISFGSFIEVLINKVLQASGNMIVPMISQLIGAITNIILDPILIFGWLGLPAMGIAGAAYATVAGQILAMVYAVIMMRRKSHDIHISLRRYKPDGVTIKEIYRVGAPSIVMNAVSSVTTTAMNAILVGFSETAVAVLGIYFKLQSFVFMPIFGLTQGAMPIMGYNFGAGNRKRFDHAYRLTLQVAAAIMLVGTALFQIFPQYFMIMFDATENMMNIGVTALRIISLCFIPAAFGISISSMFQAIGHGFQSLLMSLLRQLVILLPVAWIMGQLVGLTGVWTCYAIAEVAVMLIFLPISIRTIRTAFAMHNVLVQNGTAA